MAETTVNIAIKTTANTAGAAAAEKSLKELAVELKETQRQMHKLGESSPDYAQVSARADELRGRLNELPPINSKVGKSSGDAGRGVLELSRAFEDAQYGISGVLNNIPGVISMFGGGAGLAGVISLAAVAASVLSKRLDGANFDSTWVGDLKTGITEMVNGMTEEEKRLRDLAESPLSWIKNSEEAFAAQESVAERALNKEIELLTLRRDLIKETIDLRAAEVAHQAKLDEINRIDRPKGTDEWVKDQQKENQNTLATKEAQRVAALKKAEQEKLAADEDARKAEQAAAAQEKRAEGLKTRELKTKQAAASSLPTEFDDQLSLMESYAAGGSNTELDAQIQDLRNKQRAKREAMMVPKDLPTAAPGETVKGAEAKAEELALKAQELRLKKAREAQEFAAAKEASRKAAEINQAEFNAAQGDVQSEVFGKVSKDQDEAKKKAEQQRQGKDREQGQLPTTDTAPAPVLMQDQINAANNSLNNLAGSTGDAEAKLKLQAMYAALNDGKGETAKELATIQQMLSDMGTTDSERRAALNSTLRQLESLQRDGSAMQSALTGALSGLVQNQQELVAILRGIQPQIDQIRLQANTR